MYTESKPQKKTAKYCPFPDGDYQFGAVFIFGILELGHNCSNIGYFEILITWLTISVHNYSWIEAYIILSYACKKTSTILDWNHAVVNAL